MLLNFLTMLFIILIFCAPKIYICELTVAAAGLVAYKISPVLY